MLGFQLRNIQTVLCLGAHSDDLEIGCGGAILDLIASNPDVRIHWCVFSADQQRAAEARTSAAKFLAGAADHRVEIFAFRDSFFPNHWGEIKETLSDLSKRVQPDLIFTHRLEDRHQDHRLIAELTWCAFRNHLILEYEIPKYEGDLGQPNLYWTLSRAITQQKIDHLLEAFATQADKPWFDAELFQSMLRLRGSECHAPSKLAEGFYCRKAVIGRSGTD
ncbi:GlcNAc-PI de-N-acetylase [Stieleria neptunia]|uniref:GlcNAc-PI de-N-acetylase n=1 Tax=Stieleria neptunia TaxID=2527979 RepID=A0A518HT45_9BACT|nr:PIG-L deacetylase family protein [Stieleria neptunia]QDV44006.1 GlcNAc-PI de-N-acetylase [Stieleria neptunia]